MTLRLICKLLHRFGAPKDIHVAVHANLDRILQRTGFVNKFVRQLPLFVEKLETFLQGERKGGLLLALVECICYLCESTESSSPLAHACLFELLANGVFWADKVCSIFFGNLLAFLISCIQTFVVWQNPVNTEIVLRAVWRRLESCSPEAQLDLLQRLANSYESLHIMSPVRRIFIRFFISLLLVSLFLVFTCRTLFGSISDFSITSLPFFTEDHRF